MASLGPRWLIGQLVANGRRGAARQLLKADEDFTLLDILAVDRFFGRPSGAWGWAGSGATLMEEQVQEVVDLLALVAKVEVDASLARIGRCHFFTSGV